jgi:Protein of unknown function (DUF4233)
MLDESSQRDTVLPGAAQPGAAQPGAAQPGVGQPGVVPPGPVPPSPVPPSSGGRPSGLRNPTAAVHGVGAGALAAEGLVLLLALEPMWVLKAGATGIAVVALLAAICFVLAALVRRAWVWYAAIAVPAALVVCGFVIHPSLAVLGVLFGLLWAYVLHVRRSVLR